MKKLLQLILVLLFFTGSTNIITAETEIPGGDVSGTWTFDGSPYMINGDITIPDGQTLIIEPGVEVIFTEHYRFDIEGQLLAVGTKDLMITFTAQDSLIAWNGLRFKDIPVTNDTSKLVYSKVQYGFPTGLSEEDKSGGGIFVQSVDKLLVAFCEITENRTQGFIDTGGGGIGIDDCSPHITNNLISNNNASGGHGGGIAIVNNSNPVVTNNLIINNSAFGGGGIAVSQGEPVLFNNTVTGNNANHGGGVDFPFGSATYINTIIYGNSATDVGDQVHMGGDYSANFLYCDVEGGIEAFACDHLPAPCLDYNGSYENNIDADPLFVDNNNDFHLRGDSPCIGAGIDSIEIGGVDYQAPSTDFEGQSRPMPPGSNPDIGAIEHEFGIPTGIEQIENTEVANLLQSYPNPVSTEAWIPYYLNNSGIVTIEIFDLFGQRIITLTQSYHSPGEHYVMWNTKGVSNGIYICTMKVDGTFNSRKIIIQR